MSDTKRILAKNVNFVVGVTVLGSKLSLQASKSNELEVTSMGIKATSKNSGRVILIPFSNITGMELYPDTPSVAKTVPRANSEAKPTQA